MEEAQERLKVLMEKARKEKIDLSQLKSIEKRGNLFQVSTKIKVFTVLIFVLVFYGNFGYLLDSEKCFIAMPPNLDKVFRKPQDCSFCRGVDSGLRVSNIHPDEFEEKYAYSGHVVVVTDAMKNWTATEVFDFWFFKNLYEREDPKRKTLESLKMEKDRVEYKPGSEPWYFGWSNCNEHIASRLRKHYDRPYFLPKTSELNSVDWIFMGGRGLGAHMHLDNIRLPSWQAQLKGTKEWLLAPPPECLYECNSFSVIVNPGDMIVLNTNKWFHKTNVLSNDISITIGAEYD